MNRIVSVSLAVFFGISTAACSGSSSSPGDLGIDAIPGPCDGKEGAALSACANDYYLGKSDDPAPEACGPLPTTKLDANVPVRFFRGPDVAYEQVANQGKSLARYFDPYALTFVTDVDVAPAGYTEALSGTEDELNEAVQEAGFSPPYSEADQEAITKVVAGVLFKNLKSTVGTSREAFTKIVVIQQIVSKDLNDQLTGGKGEIAGLGISPELLNNIADTDESKNLFALMDLPKDFTPTLFIGNEVIERLAKGTDFVVAHEMGHTLGLQHIEGDATNLMKPVGTKGCQPVLTDTQLAEIAKNVAFALPNQAAVKALAKVPSRITARLMLRGR